MMSETASDFRDVSTEVLVVQAEDNDGETAQNGKCVCGNCTEENLRERLCPKQTEHQNSSVHVVSSLEKALSLSDDTKIRVKLTEEKELQITITSLCRDLQVSQHSQQNKLSLQEAPTVTTQQASTSNPEMNSLLRELVTQLQAGKEALETQLQETEDRLDEAKASLSKQQQSIEEWQTIAEENEILKATVEDRDKELVELSTQADKVRCTVVEREAHIAKLTKQLVSAQQQDQQSDESAKPSNTVAVQFNYLIPSMDNLSKVHIAGKKLFLVQGEGAQLINWEEYGLRIGVSEGTLSSSETAEVAVVALVGGQFLFPENTKLVSAVYAVSVSGLLLKPLRLEVQHCVDLTSPAQTKYLKFAIAPVNTPSLPYKFSLVEGGEFTIGSRYGSIDRYKFCLVSILGEVYTAEEGEEYESEGEGPSSSSDTGSTTDSSGEEEGQQRKGEGQQESIPSTVAVIVAAVEESLAVSDENVPIEPAPINSTVVQQQQSTGIVEAIAYAGLVYYEQRGVTDLVTFTAAKHLNALLQYVKTEHSQAEIGQNFFFYFKPSTDYIELIFDTPQKKPITGWTIDPHIEPCTLYKDDVDNFGTSDDYPLPPICLISVYGSPAPDTVPILRYAVPVEGVVRPVTLFICRPLRVIPSATAVTAIAEPITATVSMSSHTVTRSDRKLRVAEVFQRQYRPLMELMSIAANRSAIAADLHYEELISDACYSEATAGRNFYDDRTRGASIVKAIRTTIEKQPKLLHKLIDVLERVEAFRKISDEISDDIYCC